MHEFSIATQILEDLMAFAAAHDGKEILTVRLEIGELMCVEHEQLRFCYDSIKMDTPLQNSTLEIITAPAVVECPICQYEGTPKYWDAGLSAGSIATLQCPACGKAAKAIRGHDCAIRSVQLIDSREMTAV
jgi:hydrogenase nickel incorporation protein HypA/HybF